MDPKNYRDCTICNIQKSLDMFDKKKYTCKICNSDKIKERKIRTRQLYREAYKQIMISGGMLEEDYDKHFIPFEKYNIMKKLPELYSFCECSNIKKLDMDQFKYEYNKFYINVVFCVDKRKHIVYVLHII